MRTTRRRLALVAATAAFAVALTGCGDSATTAETPTSEKAASAAVSADPLDEAAENSSQAPRPTPGTPEISLDAEGRPDYCADQKRGTGPAAKEFGAQEVLDAYCQMVTLTMDISYQPNLLRKAEDRQPIEFSVVEPYLDADLRENWRDMVQQYVSPKGLKNEGPLHALMFTDVTNPSMTFPEDESTPIVYNKRFGAGSTDVRTNKQGLKVLYLAFDVDADLLMLDNKTGEEWMLPVGKRMEYWLKPSASEDTPWLIDGYDAEFRVGDRFKPKPIAEESPGNEG